MTERVVNILVLIWGDIQFFATQSAFIFGMTLITQTLYIFRWQPGMKGYHSTGEATYDSNSWWCEEHQTEAANNVDECRGSIHVRHLRGGQLQYGSVTKHQHDINTYIHIHNIQVTSCLGFQKKPQTAYPMSFSWASHMADTAWYGMWNSIQLISLICRVCNFLCWCLTSQSVLIQSFVFIPDFVLCQYVIQCSILIQCFTIYQ